MIRILLSATLFIFWTSGALPATVMQDGKKYELAICGGKMGLRCKKTEWCDYPKHTICGGVDGLGRCKPRPQICPRVYIPVCGCDGETYGNACEAAAKGWDVAHEGACRSRKH